MKRATLATTITAAAVVVAGGAIGAFALTQDEPTPEPTVQTATTEPTPEVTEAPTGGPTPEPTETVTSAPAPTVSYSEGEQGLMLMTQTRDLANLELAADEILEQAEVVCAARAAGDYETAASFEGATAQQLEQFASDAGYYVCGEYTG